MKRTLLHTLPARWGLLLIAVFAICIGSVFSFSVPEPTTWKFAVMSDTQWTNAADAANNPGTVAVGIINQLNQQFIAHGVKFVVQVGDLDDREDNYSGLPATPRIGISTRAAAAQALYNAGIGFFPLRGNHEGSQTAAGEFQALFSQTQGQGSNTFGTSNFNSPSGNLTGLSYSFDYNNARFVLLDQFTPTDGKAADGTTYNVGNNAISSQQSWISSALTSKPAGSHAFVFSHKQLFGGNHTDTLFNTAASNAAKQNAFIASLDAADIGYLFSGHDHMHNYSIVTSPDGLSKTRQLICASDSYKFYTPGTLASHGTDPGDTGYPNAGLIAKNRETEISQELYSTGYYIVTVDGSKVTVDFYSADPTPATPGLADVDLQTTPTLTFSKRETFGYSLNGQQYIVTQGQSYTSVNETFGSTAAAILSGTNSSTRVDYNGRALVKAVNTGWTSNDGSAASDIFSLWGMAEGLNTSIPYVETDTTLTDTFVLSMSYDPALVAGDPLSGNFGLVVKDKYHGWVNAVAKNFGGTLNFIAGPWAAGYGLGTYGVDTATHTVWAVINHNSEFAAGTMNPANAAPTVAIITPVDNAIFNAPADITITANAVDDGSIAKVEFYSGSNKIGEATAAPFTITWSGILSGSYTLSAIATDNEGLKAPSASINIVVNNPDNILPTVALTAPAEGLSVYTGQPISLAAIASDQDGFVTKVEFFANATKLGERTTAPYSITWPTTVAGNYALTAIATDNDGGTKASDPINVSVIDAPRGGVLDFFENLNSMGTTGTTPPAGWSIKNANSGTSNSTWLDTTGIPASGSNSVATMVNASGALTASDAPASNQNNGYNAGAPGDSSNRMIATAPTSVAGVAIQLQLTNTSAGYIDQLMIGYDIYRFNAPASVNELPGYQLFYSLDNGASWINVVRLNPTVSGPQGVIVPNTVGVTHVLPTLVTLSSKLNPGAGVLFRWVDDNAVPTSPDQIYGLDNVSIYTPIPNHDFNGDRKTDIFWRNTVTGENLVSLLDGTTISDNQWIVNIGPDWKPAAFADFNGDKANDIVWQNSATGEILFWFMKAGEQLPTSATIIPSMGSGWKLVGAGNYDDDGKPDLFWRNTSTGENVIWLMEGTSYKEGSWLVDIDPKWQFAGIADLDGDGKNDILLQDSETCLVLVWFMDGQALPKSGSYLPLREAGWKVVGTGDFNADGHQDILWQNRTTGVVSVWLLDGLNLIEEKLVTIFADPSWEIGEE